MELELFKKIIKDNRNTIIKPYDLIFQEFQKLEISKLSKEDINSSASSLITNLRKNAWQSFVPIEKDFTIRMLKTIVEFDNEDNIANKNGIEAISTFIEKYPDHIYQLILSNTNSRRSRAGKEFEAILELLLMACDYPMDSQGNIGKKVFTDEKLGKMVDIVLPSAVHFSIDKYSTILISAKTTLRERWQEVSEESNRTSATSMYLATLDDTITSEVISSLNEAGVRLVVLKEKKELLYSEYNSVISYEDLFSEINAKNDIWVKTPLTDSQSKILSDRFNSQKEKHKDNAFISKYYDEQIDKFENNTDN